MLMACALNSPARRRVECTTDSLVVADLTVANNQHTAKTAQEDSHNISLYKNWVRR